MDVDVLHVDEYACVLNPLSTRGVLVTTCHRNLQNERVLSARTAVNRNLANKTRPYLCVATVLAFHRKQHKQEYDAGVSVMLFSVKF